MESSNIPSYVCGEWFTSSAEGLKVYDPCSGHEVCQVSSEGINFADVMRFAREKGGPALRQMRFHERAAMLKNIAQYLLANKESLYELSYATGATRADGWIDIEGGIATFFSYSSLVRRELADERFLLEGPSIPLAKDQSFAAPHLLVPKEGVAFHINAFNFPCWGMLEKLACNLLAGVPAVVKPASQTAFLSRAVLELMLESEQLPLGAVQMICGSAGDSLDHLNEQDSVSFTGSAATSYALKAHPNIIQKSIPFNAETDSLNACVLGDSVALEDPEFELCIDEIVKEVRSKSGQRCTAIRRVLVAEDRLEPLSQRLVEKLQTLKLGDPRQQDTDLGPLVSRSQKNEVEAAIAQLAQSSRLLLDGRQPHILDDIDSEKSAFLGPSVLINRQPLSDPAVHEIEAFGPVVSILPYKDSAEAIDIIKRAKGSLVSTIVSNNAAEIRKLSFGIASHHGRLHVLNRHNAKTSTGHGSPLPQLKHGGPGRAGGGEELAGIQGIKHYMQRVAIQADPDSLTQVSQEYVSGASTQEGLVHPFKKRFGELHIGDSFSSHRRTISEADIVNFACLSGDHFYAHMDEIAATASLFGRRVAHGYFLVSAAAGLFVDPAPGPVLANYGLENLRFIQPVGIGDTISVRLVVKQKIAKAPRPNEMPNGVVTWHVNIYNQHDDVVASYDILTLVAE